jgi:hypothetical protein
MVVAMWKEALKALNQKHAGMFPYGLLEAAKALTTDHESPEIGT